MEFDAEGNLYALEFATESSWKTNPDPYGALIKIAPDGTRTTVWSGEGLFRPTALDIGPDGAFYVTNQGDVPGGGQVLRIENAEAVPEPSSALGVLALGSLGFGLKKRKAFKSRRSALIYKEVSDR